MGRERAGWWSVGSSGADGLFMPALVSRQPPRESRPAGGRRVVARHAPLSPQRVRPPKSHTYRSRSSLLLQPSVPSHSHCTRISMRGMCRVDREIAEIRTPSTLRTLLADT